MTGLSVRRCGMTACASTDRVRPYPCGWRCSHCSPSSEAGVPDPDELLRLHRAALATTTNTDTERTKAA
jgi:hypothetical protein